MTGDEALERVEQVLERGKLNQLQELVFREAWNGRSYGDMAKASGYDAGYIKDTGSKLWQMLSKVYGVKVTKQNLQGVVKRAKGKDENGGMRDEQKSSSCRVDWGDAVDTSIFYGRTRELENLQHWIEHDRCRFVTLLGMGGMGKTLLSVRISELVQQEFDYVIWRSLRDAPLPEELVASLIAFLSPSDTDALPKEMSAQLLQLIQQLRRSRCLIVLDNFDAVLQSGQRAGTYRAGYEAYGELLKRIGEIAHSSCVILTSREKPQEVAMLEGDRLPIRTLSLTGVDTLTGQHILLAKGLCATTLDVDRLIKYYSGNPLALKIAATSIRDLFASNVAKFLDQGGIYNGIAALLGQQCDRLSRLEQQVMYWLAINREPVTLMELQADIGPQLPGSQLMEVLESLCWRSLIESSGDGFTQQPVVMEAITEQFTHRLCDELVNDAPKLFFAHAVVKSQAKDYIRDSQIRLIVQPLIDRVRLQLGDREQLCQKLDRVLSLLRQSSEGRTGYGAGNGSQDETLMSWDLKTGQWLRTLQPCRPYEGMQITAAKGLTPAQRSTLEALGAFSKTLHTRRIQRAEVA